MTDVKAHIPDEFRDVGFAVGAVETLAALALVAGYWKRNAALGASVVLIVIMIGAIVSSVIHGLVTDGEPNAPQLVKQSRRRLV